MQNCIKTYNKKKLFSAGTVLLITMNPGKWKVHLNCFFMLYKSAETCHLVSLPCKGTNILIIVTCGASCYLRVWSVQPPIQSLYLCVRCIYMQECSVHLLYVFYSHGCNKFLHLRTFFYTHWYHFYSNAPYILYSHGWNVRAWNQF